MKKRASKPRIPDPDAIDANMGAKPANKGQIQPGEKRNPLGRPLGSKNKAKPITNAAVRDIILADNRRQHTVQDANGPVTLSMLNLAYRSLGIRAVKGSVLAARSYLELSRWAERQEAEGTAQVLAASIEYKMRYDEVKKSYARHGKKPPIDAESLILSPKGLIGMRDAATKEDIARWKAAGKKWKTELIELQGKLEGAKSVERKRIEKDVGTTELMIEVLKGALAGDRTLMWALDQAPELEAWATVDTSSEPRKAASRRPWQPGTTKNRA